MAKVHGWRAWLALGLVVVLWDAGRAQEKAAAAKGEYKAAAAYHVNLFRSLRGWVLAGQEPAAAVRKDFEESGRRLAGTLESYLQQQGGDATAYVNHVRTGQDLTTLDRALLERAASVLHAVVLGDSRHYARLHERSEDDTIRLVTAPARHVHLILSEEEKPTTAEILKIMEADYGKYERLSREKGLRFASYAMLYRYLRPLAETPGEFLRQALPTLAEHKTNLIVSYNAVEFLEVVQLLREEKSKGKLDHYRVYVVCKPEQDAELRRKCEPDLLSAFIPHRDVVPGEREELRVFFGLIGGLAVSPGERPGEPRVAGLGEYLRKRRSGQ